jgi:hypothetical protein
VTEAVANIPWLPSRETVAAVACHLGCTPEDAKPRMAHAAGAAQVRTRGVTSEGYPVSLLPASSRKIDWDAGSLPSCSIANIKLCRDDLVAADLLPGKPEGRKGWRAHQTLAWIIRRELEWTPEMGSEIKPAQLKLSEAIAARRINLWGRQPGSLQIKQIPNDLFSPSKYKVIVTPHADLSTEPPHKRHEFEQEYKDDCGWHDIIFAEDESRREWLPAGRAASAAEPDSLQPPAPEKSGKRRRRPGPRPGAINRFAGADRALFPEMTKLIKQQHISPREAAQRLSDKIKGRGTIDSRIRRLATRYRMWKSKN